MSNFVVRKCLLIKKVPTQEDGGLRVSLNIPEGSLEFRHLLCQGKEKWAGQEVTNNSRYVGANRDPRKSTKSLYLFVSSQFVDLYGSKSSPEALANL